MRHRDRSTVPGANWDTVPVPLSRTGTRGQALCLELGHGDRHRVSLGTRDESLIPAGRPVVFLFCLGFLGLLVLVWGLHE